jgi:hypothetical protein
MSLKSFIAILLIAIAIISISQVDAAYKKLPLNGSMFGKRTNGGTSFGIITI